MDFFFFFFSQHVINCTHTYVIKIKCAALLQSTRHIEYRITVTLIFRNYFIGIHIFTLVSPLDDEESHIFILNSQSLDCLLRMTSASRSFGLAWFSRPKIFVVK